MRELTGYADKHGRPILEGNILQNDWGNLLVVQWEVAEYVPFVFPWKQWVPQVVQVVESRYTAVGEAMLIVHHAEVCRRTAEDWFRRYHPIHYWIYRLAWRASLPRPDQYSAGQQLLDLLTGINSDR